MIILFKKHIYFLEALERYFLNYEKRKSLFYKARNIPRTPTFL
ncbi:hypothetical protein CP082626L3_0872 [Chlamydia psittaci 08-2626_L3]|nr:hypothetical protein CP061683_0955 [Chlamydia psittaci 06-1683]EPP28769.1 hypothetical protein CP082626L3_0872 [Chlamydia psittaci 08-2626_L3]EPP31516.1 hypothetical protein CPC197_0769 [Chlamydia psittaci C1/97]